MTTHTGRRRMTKLTSPKSKKQVLSDLSYIMRLRPRRCPDCAEEVNAFAIKCPHCGRDLPNLNCEQVKKAQAKMALGAVAFALIGVAVGLHVINGVMSF
jgi:uncharacterized protein with PIN domain